MGGEHKSEDELIRRIARALPSAIGVQSAAASARTGLALGIGDDAAILDPGLAFGRTSRKRTEWVVSTDAFLEGVHFLGGLHPADSVGYKALARATSDLAAMGAQPRMFFLALAIPAHRTGAWLDGFLRGMARAARQLDMVLAGGDTSSFGSVAMTITVLGNVPRGRAVRRSGARPGDILYVSGRLGRAQLGLELLQKLPRARLRASLASRGPLRRLLQPHLYPVIRVQLGSWLARHGIASAMMDLSDGLSTDLARLCKASGVGARVWAERIPRVSIPTEGLVLPKTARFDPLEMALHGGEDYELLFAVPPRRVKELRRAPGFSELTAIGEIERGAHGARGGRILIVDAGGRAKPLLAAGWDSFREA